MTMQNSTRDDIEFILKRDFLPSKLMVIDDSRAHKGHAEALLHPKAGHFKVEMISEKFTGLTLVERHRLVYKSLSDLMDSRIHALALDLRSTAD
jgi:BolA protein